MIHSVRTFFALLFGIALCFLVANRPAEDFFDTLNYIEMAESAFAGFDVNAEPSFIFISRSSYWAGAGAVGLFFVYAFLGILPKVILIISRLPYPFLGVILYLSGSFILQEMVQVRVGAALGMLWLSLFLYSNKKIFCSFLAALLGIFLHYSAAAVVFIAFVSRILFWKKYVEHGRLGNSIIWVGLLAVTASLFAGILFVDLTSQNSFLYEYLPVRYADGYLVSTEDRYGYGRIFFVVSLSTFAMCSLAKGWVPKEFPYLVAAFTTYTSVFVLSFFQSQPVVGSRLVDLFITFVPVLVVGIVKVKPRYGWPIFTGVAAAQFINIVFFASYYKIVE